MRTLGIAAALVAALLAAPVQAQSVREVSDVARRASFDAGMLRYNTCVYERGLFRTICDAGRLAGIADAADRNTRRISQLSARPTSGIDTSNARNDLVLRLQRLCDQGDAPACDAARGMRHGRR